MPRKKSANHGKIVEAAKHGFSKEEALHYAGTPDGFFMPGWLHVMGVPAEVLPADVSA